MFQHPDGHDIAVAKLVFPLEFNQYVGAISIPSKYITHRTSNYYVAFIRIPSKYIIHRTARLTIMTHPLGFLVSILYIAQHV